MKNIMKLSLTAAIALASLGVARADQPDLWRVRGLTPPGANFRGARETKTTTVGVYANRHGVSQRGGMQNDRSEGRWEMRFNAHGDRSLFYVPVK